jgi:hypothetical protein
MRQKVNTRTKLLHKDSKRIQYNITHTMLEYSGHSLSTTMNIVYKDQRYNKPQCGYYIQQNISMCNKTETDPSKYTYWDPIILN